MKDLRGLGNMIFMRKPPPPEYSGVTPGPRDGKVGGVTVADMRAFSSLAWVAAVRRLSVVFTIGILLLRPCAAAEGDVGFGEGLGEGLGEKVVRFLGGQGQTNPL